MSLRLKVSCLTATPARHVSGMRFKAVAVQPRAMLAARGLCSLPAVRGLSESRADSHERPGLLHRIATIKPEGRRLPSTSRAATTSATGSVSNVDDCLAALLPFVSPHFHTSSHGSIWEARISQAISSVAETHFKPMEVLLIQLGDSNGREDVLSAMLNDGMVDHTAQVPLMLSEARVRDIAETSEVIVKYGDQARWNQEEGRLEAPLPWLRDAGIQIRELQQPDLSSPELSSRLYLASRAVISLSYTALFSPSPPSWLSRLLSLLRAFSDHPGLSLTISHDGQLARGTDRGLAERRIHDWIAGPSSSHRPIRVDFVDLRKAQEAQSALRGAMGFRSRSQEEETMAESVASTSGASTDRSLLWTQFQELSTQSGLPSLISSLEVPIENGHLDLLIRHAEEEVNSHLLSSRAESDEVKALASWLSRSAESNAETLAKEVLATTSPAISRQPSHSGNEPALLPKWWKLPFIGDGESRNRVHEALEREWLGGKETEERLTWWAGRLKELQATELQKIEEIVARLHKGQRQGTPQGLESQEPLPTTMTPFDASASGTAAGSIPSPHPSTTKTYLPPMPQSRLLELRFASPLYNSKARVEFDDPTILAHPLIRARDHFFGRAPSQQATKDPLHHRSPNSSANLPSGSAAGVGLSPAEGGISILDTLQRRLQSTIYRFYSTLLLSWSVAAWGSASHHLFHQSVPQTFLSTFWSSSPTATTSAASSFSPRSVLTDIVSFPDFENGTAIALAGLGTTWAVFALQRNHSKIAKRVLTRDLLTRIPENTRGEVEEVVKNVVREGMFGYRKRVGAVLEEWIRDGEEKRRAQRKAWEEVRERLQRFKESRSKVQEQEGKVEQREKT